MKDEALRREGQLDQVPQNSTNCNSDIYRLRECFSYQICRVKHSIHSINQISEIHIFHSIDCLGRLQFL